MDTPALRATAATSLSQARLRNPGGRLTTPEDIAGVIYLLSQDEASWINGELIRVDGGEHISDRRSSRSGTRRRAGSARLRSLERNDEMQLVLVDRFRSVSGIRDRKDERTRLEVRLELEPSRIGPFQSGERDHESLPRGADIGTTDEWILERTDPSRRTALPRLHPGDAERGRAGGRRGGGDLERGDGRTRRAARARTRRPRCCGRGLLVGGGCAPDMPAEACNIGRALGVEAPAIDVNPRAPRSSRGSTCSR